MRDASTIAFTYDNLDRPTLKDLPGSEPDVTYGYDNLSRLTCASHITPGCTLAFTYDALSRNLTQAGPQGTVASQWDVAGRRTKLTYPGSGLYVDYDYLVTGEMTKIRENGATSGVGVLATYAYDNLGRRSSLTFGNGVVQGYTFDPVSRLASLTNELSGTTNDLSATFAYNPASQIASTVRTGDSYAWTDHFNTNVTGVANGLNQLTSVGPKNLSHDARGNVTAFGTKTFTYSSENLLLTGPASTTLSYDPGMRLYQSVSGGTTLRLTYDGLDRIAEYDGSNALQRRYVHGQSIDEPLVWYEGAGTTDRRFLSSDERGSIISLTDSSGALLGINRYDEYGNPQTSNVGTFGYTGQAWLSGINLWYYKARVYDPELGRFLQTDPIDVAGGINLYAYVGNDPVNFIDPLGLTAWDDCIKRGSVCGRRLRGTAEAWANKDKPIPQDPEDAPDTVGEGALVGKLGDPPPPDKKKKLSQCVQNFMRQNAPGYDWSKVVVTSADPLPSMWATNWGDRIHVGRNFDSFETDKGRLFHELAHSPQWASGELTRMGYLGSSISAVARSLTLANMGAGLQSLQQMHDSIGVEQAADAVRDSLLKAYRKAGKPCDKK